MFVNSIIFVLSKFVNSFCRQIFIQGVRKEPLPLDILWMDWDMNRYPILYFYQIYRNICMVLWVSTVIFSPFQNGGAPLVFLIATSILWLTTGKVYNLLVKLWQIEKVSGHQWPKWPVVWLWQDTTSNVHTYELHYCLSFTSPLKTSYHSQTTYNKLQVVRLHFGDSLELCIVSPFLRDAFI